MQIDARSLTSEQVIDADVCIIGAGPAGTTCAHEFLDAGLRVTLLESGGTQRDPRVQMLSAGPREGEVSQTLETMHLRQLGGTANHWILKMADKRNGYRFLPFDAIDFEAREGFPHGGWPITRAELDPFYERAHRVCGVGPFDYGTARWESERARPLQFPGGEVQTGVFLFAPTATFTHDFPALIAKSERVHSYLHATVVELLASDDGRQIRQAVVRTFEGKTLHFTARRFVLACNALQTPRLLLASRRVHPNGVGNDHDCVGRYYTDHCHASGGNFYPHDPSIINQLELYDMRPVDGASVLGRLHLAPEVMRRERLANFGATLFPMPPLRDVKALVSARALAESLMERRMPEDLAGHAGNIWRGRRHLARVAYEKLRYDTPIMPGLARGGWSRLKNNERKYNRLELFAWVEQSPNPDNRVSLVDERDELGMPRIKLRFRWDDGDLDSIRRAQAIMARALEKTGLGRYEPPEPWPDGRLPVYSLCHMSSTARMHLDPRRGVIDRHCRVHGVPNLYVAGSAAFTTSGYANPTLTNLALTIRVADHVKGSLRQAEPVAGEAMPAHQPRPEPLPADRQPS
jgi:choline dehydrogenase-like flavoprotein